MLSALREQAAELETKLQLNPDFVAYIHLMKAVEALDGGLPNTAPKNVPVVGKSKAPAKERKPAKPKAPKAKPPGAFNVPTEELCKAVAELCKDGSKTAGELIDLLKGRGITTTSANPSIQLGLALKKYDTFKKVKDKGITRYSLAA